MPAHRRSYPTARTNGDAGNSTLARRTMKPGTRHVPGGSSNEFLGPVINLANETDEGQQDSTRTTRNRTSRNTSNTQKQNPSRTNTRSATIANSNTNNSRFAHTETSNVHSLSASRVVGKTTNLKNESGEPPKRATRIEAASYSEMTGAHHDNNVSGMRKKTSNNGAESRKTASRRSMDKVAGFNGGPMMPAPGRQVQRETVGVPVAVPRNGAQPSPPVLSRSTSISEVGGPSDRRLHWGERSRTKRTKPSIVRNLGITGLHNVDQVALAAERQRKASVLKNIGFSKKVKEEIRDDDDDANLRVGMGDVDGNRMGEREMEGDQHAAVGESREMIEPGEIIERVPPPQREPSPGAWDVPGLSNPPRHIRGHNGLRHSTVITVSEPAPVPIPPPQYFSDPLDYEELYASEQVEKMNAEAQVQVKEEREDYDDLFYDSQIPFSTPIPDDTVGPEQSAMNIAPDPLDTECTIHPKNKRKQHNLACAKNLPSQKKAKTDVGEGQDEVSTATRRKRGRPPKQAKWKEMENDVVAIGPEAPTTRGEDEIDVCVADANREFGSNDGVGIGNDSMSLSALELTVSEAVLSAVASDSHSGIMEVERPENAGQEECIEAGAKISVTPVAKRKRTGKSRATQGAGSTGGTPSAKRKGRGNATQGCEQIENPDTSPKRDEEIFHPDETPKKKRRAKDQATESEDPGADPVGDGEEPPHPDETPRKRMKVVKDQATEGGEKVQESAAEHISRLEATPEKRGQWNNQVTEGEKPLEDVADNEDITRQEETQKGNTQGMEGREKVPEDVGGDEHIPRPDETPKRRKVSDQATKDGEKVQEDAGGDEHVPRSNETPKKRRKVSDQAKVQDAGGVEHVPLPNETPKRRKVPDQATNVGEKVQEDEHVPPLNETKKRRKVSDQATKDGEKVQEDVRGDEHVPPLNETPKKRRKVPDQATKDGEKIQEPSAGSIADEDIVRPNDTPGTKGEATDQLAIEGVLERKTKVVRRGRPPKKKDGGEDIKAEASLIEEIEDAGLAKKVPEKTRGRKKRISMDEKKGITDGVARKRKRVKLGIEGGEERGCSAIKWVVICNNKTGKQKKGTRKGKGKAQPTAMVLDEDGFEEEAQGHTSTRKTLRPSIWAKSKAELLLVLPELSGSKCFNGITEGSSNLPMVMLDESTAEGISVDVRWFDREESSGETPSVRLTLTRDFVCPVAELASVAGISMDSVAHTMPLEAGPSSGAMTQQNLSSSAAAPGPSSVANATGIDVPPLPAILPHYDNDEMDLEYINEDVRQEAAFAITHFGPSIEIPPVSSFPTLPRETMTMAHTLHEVQRILHAPTLPKCQIGQHDLTAFFAPSSGPSLSAPNRQLPPLHQIPHTQYDIAIPISAPLAESQIPVRDEQPPPAPSDLDRILDTIIPPSAPPEIEILTSSRRLSLPLILISSRETFNRHFCAPLPSSPFPHSSYPCVSPEQTEKVELLAEHAYVFLGFFRVVKTGERRVTLSDDERVKVSPGKIVGRVEWTFDVEWVPGYDGSRGNEETSSRPWWAPDFVLEGLARGKGERRGGKKEFTWLERYAQARLNLLPTQLVDGQEAGSSDEAMPKGWLCKRCGKLNQKVMMRHRWCGSRACRDNPLSGGYTVDLCSARDANQTLLALPITTCDRSAVDVIVTDWDDGMRTLKYRSMPTDQLGHTEERGGILKHVFTCNLVDLQTEATPLFERIQSEICLAKSTGDSGPFFKCHVSNSYVNRRTKYVFSCLTWDEAPQAVRDAQDLMTFMGKEYGEEGTLEIDQLTIVGWVSSGSRKIFEVLKAREHPIAMLCLGNDVVLTIVPKWESSAPVPGPLHVQAPSTLSYPANVSSCPPDGEIVNPIALPQSMPMLSHVPNICPPMIQGTLAKPQRLIIIKPPSADKVQHGDAAAVNHVQREGAISENSAGSVNPAQNSRITRSKTGAKPKSKQPPSKSIIMTLVHGDMLLFSGCDFEYSIKRMGTSILVIGNKENLTASIQEVVEV